MVRMCIWFNRVILGERIVFSQCLLFMKRVFWCFSPQIGEKMRLRCKITYTSLSLFHDGSPPPPPTFFFFKVKPLDYLFFNFFFSKLLIFFLCNMDIRVNLYKHDFLSSFVFLFYFFLN